MAIHLKILKAWQKLSQLPGGRVVFSKILSRAIPYTGSTHPVILEIRPGYAKVEMKDRRSVRNHLRSIHAAALMNIAEAASGLALHASMPKNTRAILVSFNIEYKKKARGTLSSDCSVEPLTSSEKTEKIIVSTVRDQEGDVVALAHAKWLISPIEKKSTGQKNAK